MANFIRTASGRPLDYPDPSLLYELTQGRMPQGQNLAAAISGPAVDQQAMPNIAAQLAARPIAMNQAGAMMPMPATPPAAFVPTQAPPAEPVIDPAAMQELSNQIHQWPTRPELSPEEETALFDQKLAQLRATNPGEIDELNRRGRIPAYMQNPQMYEQMLQDQVGNTWMELKGDERNFMQMQRDPAGRPAPVNINAGSSATQMRMAQARQASANAKRALEEAMTLRFERDPERKKAENQILQQQMKYAKFKGLEQAETQVNAIPEEAITGPADGETWETWALQRKALLENNKSLMYKAGMKEEYDAQESALRKSIDLHRPADYGMQPALSPDAWRQPGRFPDVDSPTNRFKFMLQGEKVEKEKQKRKQTLLDFLSK